MSTDDVMFATILAGVALSAATFFVEVLRWRSTLAAEESQDERRRLLHSDRLLDVSQAAPADQGADILAFALRGAATPATARAEKANATPEQAAVRSSVCARRCG
jgi:hypothetical protein